MIDKRSMPGYKSLLCCDIFAITKIHMKKRSARVQNKEKDIFLSTRYCKAFQQKNLLAKSLYAKFLK